MHGIFAEIKKNSDIKKHIKCVLASSIDMQIGLQKSVSFSGFSFFLAKFFTSSANL